MAVVKFVLKFSFPARRYAYRGKRSMVNALGKELSLATRDMTVDDAPANHRITETPRETAPTGKTGHYWPIYASLFDRTKPIKMLRLGSFYSDSVETWADFLHHESLIVGADAATGLLKITNASDVCVSFREEQNDELIRMAIAEFGPFDAVLDDGEHTSRQMIKAFRSLFPTALRRAGMYIVQGVDLDYKKPYRDSPISFIDFVRALIDAMHAHHLSAPSTRSRHASQQQRIQQVAIPSITPLLKSIEIYDSVVVVRRAEKDLTQNVYRT